MSHLMDNLTIYDDGETPVTVEYTTTVDGDFYRLVINADGRVRYTGPDDNTPPPCGSDAVVLFANLRSFRGSPAMDEFISAAMDAVYATWPDAWPVQA